MSEIDSSKPVLCACGCGGPLNQNHLQEQIYVTLADGKSVMINMSCWIAAYGENAPFSDENRRWPKPLESQDEESCPHDCGIPLKYHAWSDCAQDQAVQAAMSQPTSAKAKEFYESLCRDQKTNR